MNSLTKSMVSGAVFLALAGGAVALMSWDKKSRQADTERKEKEKQAFDVKAEDIIRIEVKYAGPRIVAAREGKDWNILDPVAVAGDPTAFDAMAASVAAINVTQRIPAKELDPESVGLGAPTTKVIAGTADGKQVEVWVGRKNPFDETTYVRAGANPAEADVSLIPNSTVDNLQKTLLELREQRMLPLSNNEVDAVEVVQHHPVEDFISFRVERAGDSGKHKYGDRWKVTRPAEVPADQELVNAVVNALTSFKSIGWVDEPKDLADFGLKDPATTVTLVASGKEYVMDLGIIPGQTPRYYAKRRDRLSVAEMPTKESVTAVRATLAMLRDKRVLDFDRDAVASIQATLINSSNMTLARQAADAAWVEVWRVTQPQDAPAKGWKVSSLLYTLTALKLAKVVRDDLPVPTPPELLKPYGLDAPVRQVVLKDAAGKDLSTLLLGKPEGTEIYVMRQGSGVVGLMDGKKVTELPDTVEDFLESTPDKPAAAEEGAEEPQQ